MWAEKVRPPRPRTGLSVPLIAAGWCVSSETTREHLLEGLSLAAVTGLQGAVAPSHVAILEPVTPCLPRNIAEKNATTHEIVRARLP